MSKSLNTALSFRRANESEAFLGGTTVFMSKMIQ